MYTVSELCAFKVLIWLQFKLIETQNQNWWCQPQNCIRKCCEWCTVVWQDVNCAGSDVAFTFYDFALLVGLIKSDSNMNFNVILIVSLPISGFCIFNSCSFTKNFNLSLWNSEEQHEHIHNLMPLHVCIRIPLPCITCLPFNAFTLPVRITFWSNILFDVPYQVICSHLMFS